jgi:glycine C-acetyltransferase
MLTETTELRDKLERNTKYFREKITAAGFDIKPGEHPIVPYHAIRCSGGARFCGKIAG